MTNRNLIRIPPTCYLLNPILASIQQEHGLRTVIIFSLRYTGSRNMCIVYTYEICNLILKYYTQILVDQDVYGIFHIFVWTKWTLANIRNSILFVFFIIGFPYAFRNVQASIKESQLDLNFNTNRPWQEIDALKYEALLLFFFLCVCFPTR